MNTVFFDWGGVIASDPGDDFLAALLKQIGATDEQIPTIFQTYMRRFTRGQITEAQFWSELRTNYGLVIPESISDEFAKWNGLNANQDVLALVKEVREKGLKVALLTNVIEPSYAIIERAGYYDLFDSVIASYKVGFGKPDKEIYEIALKQMNTTADQSLFIDDKQAFLDPAIEMGFTTILAISPEQIIEDVRNSIK
jgi:putative hydrolase of the HAD superfamily